jgi:hypothetical protein
MSGGRDQVTLSAKERQSLAHLEERVRLDDPDFASRMRGRSWRLLRRVVQALHVPALPVWMGPVLLVVGLAATLLVVGPAAWLSVVTVGVATLGAYGIGTTIRGRLDKARGPASE